MSALDNLDDMEAGSAPTFPATVASSSVAMTTLAFLTALWPALGVYVVSLLFPGKDGSKPGFWNVPFHTIEDAAAFAVSRRDDPNVQVYHGVHTFAGTYWDLDKRGNPREKIERTQDNAAWARSVPVDWDVGESKPGRLKYKTYEDAVRGCRDFCRATELPKPTLLVSSGYGLHTYWIFNEAIPITTWEPIARRVLRLLDHQGARVDRDITVDAARVLRPLHSFNRKTPDDPRRITLACPPGAPLDLAAFLKLLDAAEAIIPDLPPLGQGPARNAKAKAGSDLILPSSDLEPPTIKQLGTVCGTFRRMAAEAKTCNGAVWRNTLCLIRHTTGGEAACFKASEGHREFDPVNVQAHLDRWRGMGSNGMGPPRCGTLQNLYGADSPCPACPHHGQPDSSPIAFARRAAPRTATAEDGTTFQKAIITVEGGEIAAMVDAAAAALLAAGAPVHQRGGKLVRPVMDEVPASRNRSTTVARLAEIRVPALVDLLARAADFQRWNPRSKSHVRVNPPREVAEILLTREGSWPFAPVIGCITAPTMRGDGTILQAPGYDAASRLFHLPTPGLTLPALADLPTRADAQAALGLLNAILDGFPFVAPLDRAVALSALLTAVLRGGMTTAPLHLIRAHTAGTGKSFLVDLAATIATGRPCPVSSVGAGPEELEKRLVALLLGGSPMVSLDNCNGEVGGDVLCQVVERPLVSLRPLGVSEVREVECRAAVFATGNNASVTGDMSRRTLTCNLDARVERPELRRFGFDPLERVLAERGRYIAAVLTIARFGRTAGGAAVCSPLGSYADWSAAVRVPLVMLGMDDPAASMEAARAEDPELVAIRELFGHWEAAPDLVTGEFYRTSEVEAASQRHGASPMADSDFRSFLLRHLGTAGMVSPLRLGKFLRRTHGRVVDGYRLEMRPDAKHGHTFALVKLTGS